MTITLTREEAQQVLGDVACLVSYAERAGQGREIAWQSVVEDIGEDVKKSLELLRARLAQPEPEPVADKYLMEVECTKCGAKQDGILTVNAPPQRNWQGLTDEEAKEVWKQLNYDLNHGKFAADDTERHVIVEFYRAIKAKLKEKNNG